VTERVSTGPGVGEYSRCPRVSPFPTNADLGRALRRLRHVRRLSVEDLAGRAGMHPTYLSSIERGERNPSWAKLCGLARGLRVSLHAIVRAAEGEAYGGLHAPHDGPRGAP
jgi:transcriptional regulator with XRE-family HTH domain